MTEDELEDIDFKGILHLKTLLKRILLNNTKIKYSKKNIKQLIMDMKDEKDYNITTKLYVEFKRKNKTYKKDIYMLMNAQMKKNVSSDKNLQFFSDTTYQCVPPQNSGMKLFVLLAYN